MIDHQGPHEEGVITAGAQGPSAVHRARIEKQVAEERVAIVYALTPTPVLAGLAFATLVAVVQWPYRPAWLVLGWLALKYLVGGTRFFDGRRFEALRSRDERLDHWRRRSLLLLTLDGLIWGSMGVLFMPAEAPGVRAVMLASLIGIAGVGVFSYASDARGGLLLLVSVLMPSMVYQALRNTDDGWLASIGLAIYLAMMCLEARRTEGRVVEMLRLRFENACIAEERHQAMLLSQHASAAKSRFLATVSHEMRTPLNGIMGMTQLLQRSALSAQQREQVDIIAHSSRHLQSVIGDLLDLSRIEFGKLALDDEPLLLEDTVREVTGLLQAVAQDKGLRCTVEFAPSLPGWVMGDASRIKQVLHNLLGNAIKFTARGEVTLQVMRDGGDLVFRVRDTGEGVPQAMSERIFEAFEQGPSAAVDGRAGTGLGLTISRRLARAMGGDVACEPTFSRGASFVFRVPCRLPSAVPTASSPMPALRGAPAAGTVLVVDDNAVNALVASAMLETAGLTVEVAEDGESALQRMARGGIDVVLMDCQLPGIDGWEATRRWRGQEPPGERLPIIALTANAVVGDRDRCLRAGMDDYLAKPVQMDELIAVVTRHLSASEEPATLRGHAASG